MINTHDSTWAEYMAIELLRKVPELNDMDTTQLIREIAKNFEAVYQDAIAATQARIEQNALYNQFKNLIKNMEKYPDLLKMIREDMSDDDFDNGIILRDFEKLNL